MDISDRKQAILQKIVALYTSSGDPVGSRILSGILEEFSVSSATLRNEMAELTGLGLLDQPHTSAGRVPTTLGYRYYVDHLIHLREMSDAEKRRIDSALSDMDSDPDRAAEEAARLLAETTGLASIATTPAGGNVQITHYYVVRAGRYNLAVLGITTVGGVKSRVCRVAEELSDRSLEELTDTLNQRLVFVSPEDIHETLLESIQIALSPNVERYRPVIRAAVSIIQSLSDVRVYTDGQQHLLAYTELDDHIRELLELFSDEDLMRSYLGGSEPLRVLVGDEPGAFGIDSLGVVMGRYRAAGGRHGALAVAGPVRMDYGFVIPRLSYFRDHISKTLTGTGL